MAIIRVIKDNFNQGELGPFLLGRNDNPIYEAGVLTAENWMSLPEGGISRRPGFQNIDGVGPLVPPPPPPPPPDATYCAYHTKGEQFLDVGFSGFGGLEFDTSGPVKWMGYNGSFQYPNDADSDGVNERKTFDLGALTLAEQGAYVGLFKSGTHVFTGGSYYAIDTTTFLGTVPVISAVLHDLLPSYPGAPVVPPPSDYNFGLWRPPQTPFGFSMEVVTPQAPLVTGVYVDSIDVDNVEYGSYINIICQGSSAPDVPYKGFFPGLDKMVAQGGGPDGDWLFPLAPLGTNDFYLLEMQVTKNGSQWVCCRFIQRSTDNLWLQPNGTFSDFKQGYGISTARGGFGINFEYAIGPSSYDSIPQFLGGLRFDLGSYTFQTSPLQPTNTATHVRNLIGYRL